MTHRLDAELRERHDLPLTWYDALWQLWNSPAGQLRMTDLADRILLTQSGLTRLVSRLEDEGLVQRMPDPDDGRVTLAGLTPAGRGRLAEAHPTHVAGIRRYFLEPLNREHLDAMADAWWRLSSQWGDSGTPPG
ncbi:MAG: MarR family transcriptional regulator [Longimicrobiales bacterium]|nr:MarR family transcriptional regulator [Longimicrobiales bacterium]